MLKRSRRRLARRPRLWGSMTLSLFIILVSFGVMGRLLQLDMFVTKMCYSEYFRASAPSSVTISVVEWILIIAALCGGIQLSLLLDGLLSGTGSRLTGALGLVNTLFAVTLFWGWAQMWAFWHPEEPLGRWVSMTSWQFPFGQAGYFPSDRSDFRSVEIPFWEELNETHNDQPVFRHKSTGVTMRYELIGQCLPPEILRENVLMQIETGKIPADVYSPDMTDDRHGWVYRDQDGVFIYGSGLYLDRIGDALRLERQNARPKPSRDEWAEIMAEEYELAEATKVTTEISIEDFTRRYQCILEAQRKGEDRDCEG